MELKISHIVVDATEDAVALQKGFLNPLAAQLGARTQSDLAQEDLSQGIARNILDIMEAFASRSHIDARTQEAFATALALLATDPETLAGHTAERAQHLDLLRACLTDSADRPMRQVAPVATGFTVLAASALLTAARAISPQENDATFDEESVLAARRCANEFVFNMHIRMQLETTQPRIDPDDRLKIRMILDIVEKHLPERQPATIEERLSPEGRAALQASLRQEAEAIRAARST